MLNLLYPDAMPRYLARFADAFSKSPGPLPRGLFHDSYEYSSDWSPDFLAQFANRRGYRLETGFPALFEGKGEPDHVGRVKEDYRRTASELIEDSIRKWTEWGHAHGMTTRNQAHGSPGNWLDIYAASDIPETEFFAKSRNILVSKFASSAAHVSGRNLVGAETGTWISEHFTETLIESDKPKIHLRLEPGESTILRFLHNPTTTGTTPLPVWHYWDAAGAPVDCPGRWSVKFIDGGPKLPDAATIDKLTSWTSCGGTDAQAFAGTARYTLSFDLPSQNAAAWALNLGQVKESARVRINGQDIGTLIVPPFRVNLTASLLKPTHNILEVDVTNTSANRIRDLDLRKVQWKIFGDANVKNMKYKPFDASGWPVADAGLIGPVTLTPIAPVH